MGGYYSIGQVCLNGHKITGDFEETPFQQHACSECGASTVTACPACKASIRGYHDYIPPGGVAIITMPIWSVSKYCYNCGNPYPWTQATIDAFNEIIDIADELDIPEKTVLKEAFPALLVEQPSTSVAALKTKNILKHAGQDTLSVIKNMLIEKGLNETFLSLMGWVNK